MLHKKNVSVENYNSLIFLYFNRFKIDLFDLFNFHSFIVNITTKWNTHPPAERGRRGGGGGGVNAHYDNMIVRLMI